MSDLKEKVIEAGWEIRSKGGIVDRISLAAAINDTQQDAAALIALWQQHIQSDAAEYVQADLIKPDIERIVNSLADQIGHNQHRLQQAAEQKIEAMQQQLFQLSKGTDDQLQQALARIDKLEQERNEQQASLTEVSNNKDNLSASLTSQQNQLTATQQEARTLTTELEQAKNKISALEVAAEQNISQQQQSATGLERQLIDVKATYAEDIKEKEATIRDLLDKQAQQETVQADLTKQLAHLAAENKEKETQFNQQLSADEESAQNEIRQFADKLQTLQQAFDAEKTSLQKIEQSNKALLLTKNNLQQKLDQVDRDAAGKALDAEKAIQEQVAQKAELIREIELEKKQSKQASDEIAELNAKLNTLATENKNKAEQFKHDLSELKQANTHQLAALEQQLSQQSAIHDELKQQLSAEQHKYNEYVTQQQAAEQTLQAEVNTAKQQIEAFELTASQTASEQSQLKENVTKLQNKYEQARDRYNQDHDATRDVIKELRDQNQVLSQQLHDLEHDSQEQLTEYRLKFEYAQRQLTKMLETTE